MKRQDIAASIDEIQAREFMRAQSMKAGLPIPPKPEHSEELYNEWERIKNRYGGIANIPYSELGDYLDQFTGLVSYARFCEAVADIDCSTAREIRDTVKKQLYTIQDGGRELRDALVHIEPIFMAWERKFTESQALYIATKALREGYEIRANAISREITRRGSDMGDTRRSMNRGMMA